MDYDERLSTIVGQIYRAVPNRIQYNPGRFRVAVTQEEYDMIKQFCLKKDGYFFGRLLNFPLVIEEGDVECQDIPIIKE